ncbi:MAG: PEP-CTERM sorting domain-containing protein [Phycisphaerae bacterium]
MPAALWTALTVLAVNIQLAIPAYAGPGVPAGFYFVSPPNLASFPAGGGAGANGPAVSPPLGNRSYALAFTPGGNLFGYGGTPFVSDSDDLVNIDPLTGVTTPVGETGFNYTLSFAIDRAGTAYAYSYNGIGDVFHTIDLDDAGASPIGTYIGLSVNALAFDSGNMLFGLRNGNWLMRVNTATGQPTQVVRLQLPPAFSASGLAFDDDNQAHVIASNASSGGPARLYRLNMTSGALTFLGEAPGQATRDMDFIPEPASAMLLAIGLVAFARTRRS